MSGTRPLPALVQRLATFLTAMMLIAAISPALALAANGAPHPIADTITTAEDTPTTGNVMANDTNNGDDPMTVTAFDALAPSIGTLTIGADGAYSFTPAADWNGSTTTTYTVTNANDKSKPAIITIIVTPTSDAPTANNDTITVDEDTPTDVTAQVLANDTDPDGDTLSVTGVSNVTGGNADLSGGVVTFTPTADLCGDATGSFDYDMSDGNGGSDSASVTVDITCLNEDPVANGDSVTVDEDTATDVTAEILANDTDANSDTLSVSNVSNAAGGTVDLTAGVVTFTPAADVCGDAAGGFDYDVSDGNGGSDSASVTVDVTCENDAPDAGNDTVTIDEDTGTDVTSQLLANDTDVDGDSVSVSAVSNATGGSVDLTAGVVTFTPTANLCGNDSGSFDYDISDGNGGSDSASVTVDITCWNDGPDADDDTVDVTEDTPTDVTAGLLANDTDIDGDSLSVSDVSNATGGSVDLAAGVVTFTPTADLCGDGEGSFDYEINDGNGGTDSAHATVDITCTNDGPAADDDSIDVTEDTATDVTAQILANDTDIDGDSLSVSDVSNATGGTVDLTAGVVTFTPTANLCGDGAGSFDYDISDGNGGTASAHATVDITCVNDAPVAVDDTGAVAFGASATDFDVLANDTDVEGDTRSLVSASVSASAGTASVVGGMVRFTPSVGFSGLAVITYVVSDGDKTDSGTLNVTVGPDNIPPVASAPTVHFGSGRVDETAPLLISWSATDIGTGVASYEVQVSIAGGAFTNVYTGPGTSFTRFTGFGKTLVFRMRATDGEGNTSGWATAATRKLVAYQRNSKALTYTGTWTKVTSSGSSGTGYQYTTTLGKRALVTFTGREVIYVAPKTTKSGYAKVYADGKLIGRFNLRAASTQLGRIITSKTWTTTAAHTMRVVNDQGSRRTSVDAFIVLQ
jgi:hypothetical protein